MRETILITGGAGFIGSNLIRYLRKHFPKSRIVCFDALTYAGHRENLEDLPNGSDFIFECGDIADEKKVQQIVSRYQPEYLINCAAETHVDRSIHGHASDFGRTNIIGTLTLFNATRTDRHLKKFIQVSTDEVYGTLALGSKKKFTERSPLSPNSPYAASKAAADLLAHSFGTTYGLPVIITRSTNNYGPYQHPEKFIPYSMSRLLVGKPVALYGDGRNVRDWIHVEDHCAALLHVLRRGKPGEIYNIGASEEMSNRMLARKLLAVMEMPETFLFGVSDRPGHDRRYALDTSKIRRELGWKPRHLLKDSLRDTVEWYLNNQPWVQQVMKHSDPANPHIKD
ncbi:MAG: dTDP-glucose 4,6-dehydratase [Minisyncoccia bacterium]